MHWIKLRGGPRHWLAIAVVLIGVGALGLSAYEGRAYARRWQSSLRVLPAPQQCPDFQKVAKRRSPLPVSNERRVVSEMLNYACDTEAFIAELFAEVTRGAIDDLERGMRWVKYVQETAWSSLYPPMDADGIAIYHPLWLLEHPEMHCAQNARLVVDGFIAAGIPARVLQMKGHVSSEFYAAGKWRFAEADILGGGEFVMDHSGTPASIDDISNSVELLNTVRPYAELTEDMKAGRRVFASTFEPAVYPQSDFITPYVIKKIDDIPWRPFKVMLWLNAQLSTEARRHWTHHYGWNRYVFCERSDATCTN